MKELGPPITDWTVGWTDGVDLQSLRTTLDQDWVGSANAAAATAREDVPWLLRGIAEETRSGADPVVLLAEVPEDTDVTINDRSLFNFCRIVSSVREENVHGTENDSENVRVTQIDAEGIA